MHINPKEREIYHVQGCDGGTSSDTYTAMIYNGLKGLHL